MGSFLLLEAFRRGCRRRLLRVTHSGPWAWEYRSCLLFYLKEKPKITPGVSVGGCLKQSMVSRRQRRREKWPLGQDTKEVQLDTRQAIVERCALDGEGYVH